MKVTEVLAGLGSLAQETRLAIYRLLVETGPGDSLPARYSANYQRMNALVAYLTENCCGGAGCAPARDIPNQGQGEDREASARARRR